MFSNKEILEILLNNKDYSAIKESELYEIITNGVLKKLRADSFLYYQDDKSDYTYYLIEGEIEIVKLKKNNSSILLKTIEKDEWLGIAELFYSGIFLNDVRVKKESFVLIYDNRTFKNLTLKFKDFQTFIMKRLAKEIFNIHYHLDSNSPFEKIINLLKARIDSFSSKSDAETDLMITQEEISELIGYTRETVNKTLKKMQVEGLIKLKRGGIICNNKKIERG